MTEQLIVRDEIHIEANSQKVWEVLTKPKYVAEWEVKPNEGDVAYNYHLKDKGDSTMLRIEIGGFSLIRDGKMYYDTSVEFAFHSKQIIKKLSENLG
ncbi:hypothetical protein AB9M92_20380 [Peribacillus frigoritolerans]|uniref:hypothetical protein n=1 Tax=Peribacillus frigoritolerans TaxID=450367 RepID=UPI00351148B8